MVASTIIVRDSYDNVPAENGNGSDKNELIHNRKWDDAVEEKIATFERGHWWNEKSLHQSLGYRTPPEDEEEFWSGTPGHKMMET
ncbi:hypothetical protein [Corynebacterium pseudodiphtheriticum]|uniref:hypothetical protein n=1 Tax=Corynebacterium pseudodiphtheriticum TaxID=37637 RepID=UPI003D709BED